MLVTKDKVAVGQVCLAFARKFRLATFAHNVHATKKQKQRRNTFRQVCQQSQTGAKTLYRGNKA